MKIALMVVLAYLADNGLLVHRADSSVPHKEQRRMSRGLSNGLLGLHQIGGPAYLSICLISTASAAVLFWLSAEISYWLGGVVALAVGIEVYRSNKYLKPGGWLWRWTNLFAYVVTKLLQPLAPWLSRLPFKSPRSEHSRLFETDDLIDLLHRQARQADNRISQTDLDTAKAALTFADKTIKSALVPINKVRLVLPDEVVGPHLMDELYEQGYSAFPVGKKIGKKLPPEITGIVYVKDWLGKSPHQTVDQLAVNDFSYIEEAKNLNQALEAFLKTRSLLLIVINEREEVVGALWLEDVLEQVVGRKVVAEVENPADADIREASLTEEK